ncbi:pentapeptide repeat-containing protein [Streptomyces cyslabdanicus]|uniref:pentapeptide repeat-containing protein n=1 Tax=Streptomyces cyslabdanicus TaxID=1470456 RepID=UPI004044BE4E
MRPSADLRGCDLSGADLRQANLESALASNLTVWPAGFDAEAAGVVVTEDAGAEPDILLRAAAITAPAPALQSDLTPDPTGSSD